MTDKVSLQKENVEEVYSRASQAQAEINTIVQNTDLDYSDFDDVIMHLELIQRRSDPDQWKDY